MTTASVDGWALGVAYEAYMGRWSRVLGRAFLEWLNPKPAGYWLEVGCGIGTLTANIRDHCAPASIVACDPSLPFIEYARSHSADTATSFTVAAADALPSRDGGFDAIVSGLVLNFVPDTGQALVKMRERTCPAGTVAAYLWDYAGGVEFLRYFWEEAVLADPSAAALDESRRFGFWQPPELAALFREAGLGQVKAESLEIATHFADFEDYWQPFLGGAGPAPSYVTSLDPPRRELLRERLRRRLPAEGDGSIRLRARASVVRGVSNAKSS